MIGVVDSGSGGLSVLKEITRLLPAEKYIYYSDNANCPYGEKPRQFIVDRMRSVSEKLMSEGADIIVVACNTATSAAIADLREMYSDPESGQCRTKVGRLTSGRLDHISFIGMEPAVKPAALGTRTGVIGVLATAGTLKGSKYLTSKGNVEDNVKVVEHVGKGFVELVESGRLDGPEVEKVVSDSLQPLLQEGADIIVLGCTHYPFLLPVMRKVAGPSVRFIDPAPAVAKRLVNVMAQDRLLSEAETARALHLAESLPADCGLSGKKQKKPDALLLASGDDSVLIKLFSRIYLQG
ncbi:MAG: glutamate racemase [Candidatus Cryptobacteroides sp.]